MKFQGVATDPKVVQGLQRVGVVLSVGRERIYVLRPRWRGGLHTLGAPRKPDVYYVGNRRGDGDAHAYAALLRDDLPAAQRGSLAAERSG